MKNAKQPAKKKDLSKAQAKRPSEKELSEEQLEHVVGGAVDAFLKIDTVDTATVGSATGGAGAGKIKFNEF
jgi:bacteriocin-like protein